ncbi:MAG: A24 family peptidase [Sulfolobales archaeon]
MISQDAIKWIGYLATVVTLLIASYSDVKRREVDPRLWIFPSVAGLILIMLRLPIENDLISYLLIGLISPIIVLALSLMNLIGFADFIAMIVITLLLPKPFYGETLLPPSLVILLLSNIIYGVSMTPFIIRNIFFSRLILEKCNSLTKSLLVIITGLPMRSSTYISSGYFFPLLYPVRREDGYITWICRTSFDINEDPNTLKNEIRRLLNEGLINGDEILIVSWGAPYILFLLLGVLLYPLTASMIESFFRFLILHIAFFH